MAASTSLHEPAEYLTARTIDLHRAVVSLIENGYGETSRNSPKHAASAKALEMFDLLEIRTGIAKDVFWWPRDVGSIVLGQDLQVDHLTSDAAHEHFAISESLVLKIEAPDAICTIYK